ncbi:neuroligin-4, Y-linked [Aplysia californica]|uniref:Neuroligin-4, Y-linked n=1 Tax=Aplysia californica TaxID=6500 RepID=A0ABM0JR77_APLCA|nr:neuroligin-4, Y-linked [Aplysia californica]
MASLQRYGFGLIVFILSWINSESLVEPIVGPVFVNTPYGEIEGVSYRSQYEALPQRLINVFRGVPYAKTLKQFGEEWKEKYRFHNVDEEPSWYGTYDATRHKPACPQMPWLVKETVWGFNDIAEDCLYLDIYSPNNTNESPTNSPLLYPVLVFFPGGGFIMGASKQWPGVFLSQRNIVVVVVNYRLNALGFFSTGDRYSPGNYGLFDQRRALQFVKRAIQSFRGNPKKITIMGHSSGAASVGIHLLSPRSVGLFHQAIMLSGSELSEWAVLSREDSQEYARRLCREVGCPTGDSQQMIDCLRYSRSFEQIVNASAMVPMRPGKIGNPWAPVVDGDIVGVANAFLPDPPHDLRRQARQMRVPLLAGMVQDEGAYFIPNLPNLIDGIDKPQFQSILNEFIRYRDVADQNSVFDAMEFQYTHWPQPTNKSCVRKKLIEMMTDYMFGAAITESLRWHVQFSRVYFYVFQYSSWRNYIPQWRGISHGQDLDYVFGLPFVNETYINLLGLYPRQLYDFNDRNMSEYMITMITNFTSGGEPTPRTEEVYYFRNVSWREYNPQNHSYLSIRNHSRNMENYRMNDVYFWNNFYPKLAGYSPYVFKPKPEDSVDTADTFELTTWALAAVAGVLLIVVVCLIVVLVCRSRTKKYPKYQASPTLSRKTEEDSMTFYKDQDRSIHHIEPPPTYYSGRRTEDDSYDGHRRTEAESDNYRGARQPREDRSAYSNRRDDEEERPNYNYRRQEEERPTYNHRREEEERPYSDRRAHNLRRNGGDNPPRYNLRRQEHNDSTAV